MIGINSWQLAKTLLAELVFKKNCKKIQIPLIYCCLCSDLDSPGRWLASSHRENRKVVLVPEIIFLLQPRKGTLNMKTIQCMYDLLSLISWAIPVLLYHKINQFGTRSTENKSPTHKQLGGKYLQGKKTYEAWGLKQTMRLSRQSWDASLPSLCASWGSRHCKES